MRTELPPSPTANRAGEPAAEARADRAPAAHPDGARVPVAPAAACGADAGAGADLPAPHLVRQAIVDRGQRIVGYAVSFRACPGGGGFAADPDAAALAGVRMIGALLGDLDEDSAPGRTQLFLPAGAALLSTDFVDLLDASRTVLALGPDVEPTPSMAQRLEALCARGFRIALDEAAALGSAALWLPRAALVRIDAGDPDASAPAPVGSTNALRRHGARLMAVGVETHARFEALHRGGIDLFQGSWFAQPESLRAKAIQPAWGALLRALSLAQQDAPPHAIEAALRVDAALTYRLLRYLGAAGVVGSRGPLRSIADAIGLIGYQQLIRWLGMLLVTTDGGPDQACGALSRTALTRARLMELLPVAGDGMPGPQERFLAGLFSLLDAMLEMPMGRVLERLPLPSRVAGALLAREGALGALLRLVEDCERPAAGMAGGAPADAAVDDAAERTASDARAAVEPARVDPLALARAQLAAIGWAERFGARA